MTMPLRPDHIERAACHVRSLFEHDRRNDLPPSMQRPPGGLGRITVL